MLLFLGSLTIVVMMMLAHVSTSLSVVSGTRYVRWTQIAKLLLNGTLVNVVLALRVGTTADLEVVSSCTLVVAVSISIISAFAVHLLVVTTARHQLLCHVVITLGMRLGSGWSLLGSEVLSSFLLSTIDCVCILRLWVLLNRFLCFYYKKYEISNTTYSEGQAEEPLYYMRLWMHEG